MKFDEFIKAMNGLVESFQTMGKVFQNTLGKIALAPTPYQSAKNHPLDAPQGILPVNMSASEILAAEIHEEIHEIFCHLNRHERRQLSAKTKQELRRNNARR